MKPKTALTIILILSILGLFFSAYFAYYDTWGAGCEVTVVNCPEEGDLMSDVPICLYGIVVNLLVIVFSLLGLLGKNKNGQGPAKPAAASGPKKKDLSIKKDAPKTKGPMEDVKL